MKRINLFLIATILLAIMLIPLSVGAAGEAYVGYYDFDEEGKIVVFIQMYIAAESCKH